MNSRHIAGLEVLEKEHSEAMTKLRQELEVAKRHVETRKNFDDLAQQTTGEVKAKEDEIVEVNWKLHVLEIVIMGTTCEFLGKSII
jgi:uncharacterized protein YecA (UPF0149 family)